MATSPIFKPKINPALHRYPNEAAIIGRLVVAFGELEYLLVVCAARAVDDRERRILRALYRLRATSSRIDAADAIIRPTFSRDPLVDDYLITINSIWHCLKIRNQYAHCNWADAEGHGLFFTDLEIAAQSDDDFDPMFRHIDVPLLEEQEMFFTNTQSYLYFFESQLSMRQGTPTYPIHPKPLVLPQPLLHNSPAQHIPPWLSEDRKALHLARALAAQGGPPTPTPAQQALDAARGAKKAKQAENIRKSRQGEERAKSRSNPPDESQ
jgi:hypothetical protein